MSSAPTFGQWLRERRKALGLTQKELAQRAGCAEITLRKIEAGSLKASAQLAAHLAAVLEADLPSFIGYTWDPGHLLSPAGRRAGQRSR